SLEVARKTRSAALINHDEAKKAFDRAQTLLGDGAVSQSFFDEAEMRYKGLAEDLKRLESQEAAASQALELAELADQRMRGSIDDNEYLRRLHLAEIEALESQVDMLKSDLAKTQIASPVTGPVIEKFVDDRGVFAPGTPILNIGDLGSIEIECDVLSEEIASIRVGGPVEITGKALMGKLIAGEVKRIFPTGFMKMSALGVEQQRVKTLITFDNSEAGLRPGTSVDVKIITAESKDVLAAPDRSTIRRNNEWHVFKVEGRRAKLTPVTIGLRNDDWAEIVEGLNPGDTIIGEPKNELADGARVKPLN
ncbi:MAG: efflux RND transporter periplasmic adaptor subunit, partial [Candidatus Hydrogenedentota bacterium]